MANSREEVNSALLNCLKALSSTGNEDKRAKDYFVLKGTYPEVAFVDDLADKNSNAYYYFNRFLVRYELDTNISAEEFADFFIEKYKLSASKYSPREMTELCRNNLVFVT